MYGMPHGWGANLLMYRTDIVKPAPTSWGAVFTDASTYKGKVTAYDSPIYIADAALYLMKTKPDLNIKNPYALDQKQFDAAVIAAQGPAAERQRVLVGLPQGGQAFKTGDSVIGTTWQVIEQPRPAEKAPVKAILPREGATGWSDTWMVARSRSTRTAPTPGWSYITEPKPKRRSRSTSVRPRQRRRRASTRARLLRDLPRHRPGLRRQDLVLDDADLAVPGRAHGHQCTDYGDWTQAWTEIKG